MGKIYQKLKENLPVFLVILLVFLIIFIFMFNRIVIIKKPGEASVLYKVFFGGTVTTRVYGEGVDFIYPWDKMYTYNVRFQQVPHEFDVLTKNGLKVHLSISIRYRPEYKLVGMLHQSVGPDYVNIVVIPEIENVLRVLIGQQNAEDVYMTKGSIIEKSLSEAVEQIAQRFVKVDDVIIKRIQLPPQIEAIIQAKMEQKHLADAYKFKLEKEKKEVERKTIEAKGLKIFNQALSKEILHWMGVNATLKLSESENTKTVIIGGGKGGLPVIGSLPLAPFTEITPAEPKEPKAPETQAPETEPGG